MTSLLNRYLAGQHECVWNELRALDSLEANDPMRQEAWLVVQECMCRVRRNVLTIVDRLRAGGYVFSDTNVDPPEGISAPITEPDQESVKLCDWLEREFGPIPLVMRGWIEIVGDVILLGNHPQWPAENMLTDAMVVEYEYRRYQVEDIRTSYLSEHESWSETVAQDGLDESGPFTLPFAADALHKVNVSGGSPYGVVVPDASVDATVDLDGRSMYFTDYLRECFRWGGFPGFADREKGRDAGTVATLAADLLSF